MAVLILAVAAHTTHACLLFFNQYVEFWAPFVILVTLVPLYVATVFFFMNRSSDKKSGRNRLWIAMLLLVGQITLSAIWDMIYISKIYKDKFWYDGYGDKEDGNYLKQTKTEYVVTNIISTILQLFLAIYFVMAMSSWQALGEDDEAPAKPE